MSQARNFETFHLQPATSGEAAITTKRFRVPFAWLAPSCVLAWLREDLRRQRVMYELSRLNERELSDIRLTRDEFSEIFKPEFASRRAADEAGSWVSINAPAAPAAHRA